MGRQQKGQEQEASFWGRWGGESQSGPGEQEGLGPPCFRERLGGSPKGWPVDVFGLALL